MSYDLTSLFSVSTAKNIFNESFRLGAPSISLVDDELVLDNFPGRDFLNDIKVNFNIEETEKNFFVDAGKTSIKTDKFYMSDLQFIFNRLMSLENPSINKFLLSVTITELNKILENLSTKEIYFNYEKLKDFTYVARDYQEDFFKAYVEFFKRSGLFGCILNGRVGCGKTYMSTAIMECREMDTIFIFAPKNAIKDVWITGIAGGIDEETGEEIPSFFKEAKNYWSITEDPEMKNVYSRKDCKYFIFNFEQIENASLLLNNMNCGKIGVILDEAHCFNEMTSKRTIDFLNFCVQSNTEDLIWATGTPIKISSTEILPSLSVLTPNLSKENEKKFKNSYCKGDGINDVVKNRFQLLAYSIPRELYMSLPEPEEKDIYIKLASSKKSKRFTIDQIKIDLRNYINARLPWIMKEDNKHVVNFLNNVKLYSSSLVTKTEKREHEKYIEYLNWLRNYYDNYLYFARDDSGEIIDDEDDERNEDREIVNLKRKASTRKKYCDKYEERIISFLSLKRKEKDTFYKHSNMIRSPKQLVVGEAIGIFYSKRRLKCYNELAEALDIFSIMNEKKNKVVIFSDNVEPINTMYKRFKKSGHGISMIHGNIKKFNLDADKELRNFRKDDNVKAIAATFKSLGASRSLIQADKVVLLDQTFRDYTKLQAVGRLDRDGQTEQVTVYNIFLDTGYKCNISTRTQEINSYSREQSKYITSTFSMSRNRLN